ncbi:MAG: hypothetical protein ACEQSR_14230 [Candidatus Methylacidiphilales bacterium]
MTVIIASCTKTETLKTETIVNNKDSIITIDSSLFNGRLKVLVLDGTNNNTAVNGAQVFLYPTYEDVKRNYFIYSVSSLAGQADFGYILQGNYYLRAQFGTKSDTNVVQVLGQKIITRTMIVRQ